MRIVQTNKQLHNICPAQLARDVRSYTVEAEFLGSAACGQLVAAGIPVARAHAVQREICRSDRGTMMKPLLSTLTILSLLVQVGAYRQQVRAAAGGLLPGWWVAAAPAARTRRRPRHASRLRQAARLLLAGVSLLAEGR